MQSEFFDAMVLQLFSVQMFDWQRREGLCRKVIL